MIHLTNPQFAAMYGPEAHHAVVTDVGAVRIDQPDDQPAYTGLVLELVHLELPHRRFQQMFKLPDAQLVELVQLLMAHLGAAEIDPDEETR